MVVSSIIEGFDVDCHTLFVKFEKESTVRFSTFTEIWKEMKFSLIFSGRRVKELVCFTTEALSYTKHFLMQDVSFLRRVCALYIIYGIYYKQPVQNTSKIFITLEEWLQIKEFVVTLKENGHDDALYIILKLIFDGAFEFSATNSIRFSALGCKGLINTNLDPELSDNQKLDLNHIINNLEKIEKDYSESKKQLSVSLKIPCIYYSNDNFSKQIKEILSSDTPSVNKISNTSMTSKAGTSKEIIENMAEKRKAIREKGFKKKNKLSLYRSTVVDDRVSDDDIDLP